MITQSVVGRYSALILALAAVPAHGATYYVSTQGSDGNPGTATQPFRTITRAYSLAAPGTTVLVLPGVYTDYTSGWGLHFGSSGTASSPVIVRSTPRGGAIIDGQNASDRNVAIYVDGSYNVIDGFEIRNGPNGGITIWSDGNQILNNEIHHNGNPASTSTNGRDGVYSNEGTGGNSYVANYIHDNGRTGSNLDHGLYLCGANEVVFNNVLVRNAATGLQVAGYTTVSNLRVYNNVIAWNGTSGIILWQSLNGVDIKNNILYHNGTWGINSYAATGGGVVVDHDLSYANGSGDFNFVNGGSTYSYTLGTTVLADPVFVNETASSFDAHLGAGSPAIGAGLNLSAYSTTDLAGTARPATGSWDLGAYVYGVRDTTPPTVTLTAPANGATVSGSAVSITASATDNVGVASVQFQLNGSNLGAANTTAPYGVVWNTTTVSNATYTLTAVAKDAAGNIATAAAVSVVVSNPVTGGSGPTNLVVWMDDSLPAGAVGSADGGDGWNWVNVNPTPYSGLLAHQSNLASGLHEHWFNWANKPLAVATGDTLFTYVYLDPANAPSELMLEWNDGASWEHRAYWGANTILYGASGTAGRAYQGPLPPVGQWVRLAVPATSVGLGGANVYGMGFTLYNGRATWDYAGEAASTSSGTPPPTASNAFSWVDDALPAGAVGSADGGDGWNWVQSNPTPYSGQLAHQSNLAAGLHEHWFNWAAAAMPVGTNDTLFTYVYLDPANMPSELMLEWNDGSSWEHRAYWGANTIPYGWNGTPSRYYAGPLPPAGQWVRLAVASSAVGLEGFTAYGMGFSLYGGRAAWDDAGKLSSGTLTTN